MDKQDFKHFTDYKIVLFDAECVLCNHWSQFLLSFDHQVQFKLASVQSPLGQKLLQHFGFPTDQFDTMLFIDQGQVFTESTAFLKIMQAMDLPWSLCQIGLLSPRQLRDPLYRLIARNRYRWFGKTSQCIVPQRKFQQHFLNHYLFE